MSLRSDLLIRFAVAVALAAAVAACGRKGGLDLPPGAALDSSNAVVQEPGETTLLGTMGGNQPSRPVAPKGQNKRIPLDALLN
ncbi:MAG: lipoprotein [Pseudorhodoplanes sp.]